MDNAKIHMYKELQEMIHETGALLFFLPPYSPDLSPIEVGFSLLKRRIQRHASMAFREDPLAVLRVAMYAIVFTLSPLPLAIQMINAFHVASRSRCRNHWGLSKWWAQTVVRESQIGYR